MEGLKLPGSEPAQTLEGHESAVLSVLLGSSPQPRHLGRRTAQVLDKEWPVHHDSIPGVSNCECFQSPNTNSVLNSKFGIVLRTLTHTQVAHVSVSLKDKSVRLWNPHSGKHIKKFSGCHNQEVNDVLTLGQKKAWKCLKNWRHIVRRSRPKTWPLGPVDAARIADDNTKFVSCGSDKLIFQWDVTSGQAGATHRDMDMPTRSEMKHGHARGRMQVLMKLHTTADR